MRLGCISLVGWLIAITQYKAWSSFDLIELNQQFQSSRVSKASESSSRETCPSVLNSLFVREVKRPKRDTQQMEQKIRPPSDEVKRHFDIPSLPSNLVFDLESYDDEKRVSTPESILLNSVLHLGLRGNLQRRQRLVRT